MNEISAPVAEVASLQSAPTPPANPPPPGFSPRFGQIAAALAKAHAEMISPRRNKTSRIYSKRTNKEFTYSYTTADVLNDMIRGPLADNNLFPTHVTKFEHGREWVITTVVHGPSEQWVTTWAAIAPEDDGMKARAGAITYLKRQNLLAILNIAGVEDDDGDSATGDRSIVYQPRTTEAPKVPQTPEEKLAAIEERRQRARFANVMNVCKMIMDAPDDQIVDDMGVSLLKAWQLDLDAFSAFRSMPGREEPWGMAITRIPDALERVFGPEVSGAWLDSLRADTVEELQAVTFKVKGRWADQIREFKDSCPAGYALLLEHLTAQRARVDKASVDSEATGGAEQEAQDASGNDDPIENGAAEAAAIGAMVLPPPPDPEAQKFWPLVDQFGERLIDATSPMMFSKAYAQHWLGLKSEDERDAFAEYNADSCASAAEDDRHAGELLLDLQAPGRTMPEMYVQPPRTAGGQVQIAAYLAALRESISKVRVCELSTWQAAQATTIADLGDAIGLKVLQLVAQRRQALGI